MHILNIRVWASALAFTATLCVQAAAADDAKAARKVVGKLVSGDATLLRREAPGKPWTPVVDKEDLYSGDLLLGLPHALIELKSGVQLELQANIDGRSPYPIIESAVILKETGENDVNFVLDRGRVSIISRTDKPAKVHIRFHSEDWDMHLKPDTRVGFEVFGRWPKGSVFTKTPTEKDVPTQDLVAIMLKGEMVLNTDCHEYLMKAPPGAALFQWDSVSGCDAAPSKLAKLPDWAEPPDMTNPEAQKAKARREAFRHAVMTKSLDTAIDELLHSEDPNARRGAVYLIAATDDLPRLARASMDAKHPDVWDHSVFALRHWLGRRPGQDLKFYNFLVNDRKVMPAHAETIVQLTRSFGDRDIACPDCYEMLIDYLMHDNMAIRGLAHWHLYRLVPEGRAIKFSALDSKEERAQAHKEWKKLIPDGKLPPHPKKAEE